MQWRGYTNKIKCLFFGFGWPWIGPLCVMFQGCTFFDKRSWWIYCLIGNDHFCKMSNQCLCLLGHTYNSTYIERGIRPRISWAPEFQAIRAEWEEIQLVDSAYQLDGIVKTILLYEPQAFRIPCTTWSVHVSKGRAHNFGWINWKCWVCYHSIYHVCRSKLVLRNQSCLLAQMQLQLKSWNYVQCFTSITRHWVSLMLWMYAPWSKGHSMLFYQCNVKLSPCESVHNSTTSTVAVRPHVLNSFQNFHAPLVNHMTRQLPTTYHLAMRRFWKMKDITEIKRVSWIAFHFA